MNKVIFNSTDGIKEFEILEQTTLGGVTFILVKDDDQAYILKQLEDDNDDCVYEFAQDYEIEAVSKIFSELLEIDFE